MWPQQSSSFSRFLHAERGIVISTTQLRRIVYEARKHSVGKKGGQARKKEERRSKSESRGNGLHFLLHDMICAEEEDRMNGISVIVHTFCGTKEAKASRRRFMLAKVSQG